jgi:parallel beta-helix repeat protein
VWLKFVPKAIRKWQCFIIISKNLADCIERVYGEEKVMGRFRAGLVSGVWVLLLFVAVFGVVLNVPLVWGSGTIYIRADGSIDPPTTPITTVDNVTYTFTDSINESIVVERDNIVVDGAGYTVQGTGSGRGIDLSYRSNVTIKNMEIKTFSVGIYLYSSSNNVISGNNIIANNEEGVWLWHFSNNNTLYGNNITNNSRGVNLEASVNIIFGNNITNNWYFGIILQYGSSNNVSKNNITNNDSGGVELWSSSSNTIFGNNIINNGLWGVWLYYGSSNNNVSKNNITDNGYWGVALSSSSNNKIYHNDFRNNRRQVDSYLSANVWDDGYPSGGNYWSDYAGVDEKSGPNQDEPESDGIGDTPYVIDGNNRDHYPLMASWLVYVHDLEVILKAPKRLLPSNSTLLETKVSNKGWSNETGVTFSLSINGTVVNSTIISSLNAGTSYILNYSWAPTIDGVYNVTAYATPLPEEINVANNRKTTWVKRGLPPVYNNNTELYYETIQEAIDAPQTFSGHTIKVEAGVYYEHVLVSKSLTIIGESPSTTIIDGNGTGTVVTISARNVNISGFTVQHSGNYGHGVYFGFGSSNNSLSGNIITNNYYGIWFYWSSFNVLRNNSIIDNRYNFGVQEGGWLSNFIQDVDTSNTVDGKPIYYWVNCQNLEVPSDAGYVALINSTNVTVSKLKLKNNYQGVLLFSTTNSLIINNNITNNYGGVWLWSSNNNTIYGNDITNNLDGVYLYQSSNNNTVLDNSLTNNGIGIGILDSSYNVISENKIYGNNITMNTQGIWLERSSNNTLSGNSIVNHQYGVWVYQSSGNNVLVENNITSSYFGVHLYIDSNNNIVSDNNLINNTYVGIWLDLSFNNTLSGNSIINNSCGIMLFSSSDNIIYHNNFINNKEQAYTEAGYTNFWHNSYPSGGNYWSDYVGFDSFVGLFQNETGSDGIGDTPYIIDTNNQDHYPLINPWIPGSPTAYFSYAPRFPLIGEIVTFNASDSYDYDGDIISYEWNFGDGNITIVAEPTIVHVYTAQGVYSVNLTVTDNEGFRRSIARSIAVGTDTTPPTTLDDYDGLWHTTDFTITLTATDDLRGVAETYYKINDGPTKTVSADGQPLITTEGNNNTLEYWSVDNAGNEEYPHKILTGIKLDKTAPYGSIIINNGDAYTASSSVTLTLTASDATSGVYQMRFSNDGTTWTDWEAYTTSKSWTLPPGDGTKTVYYQIKDIAGLVSITYSDTIVLDTTSPSGSITINDGAAYTTTTSVTLTLSATDETSGIAEMRFSNDNTAYTEWQAYATSKSWTLQDGDGTKTVYVQFKDHAGLISTYSDAITLDTQPPTGSITIAEGAAYTNSSVVTLTLSATDATSGVAQMRFSNDNVTWSDWEPYATSKTWTLLTGDGLKGVTVQYKDNAGLISSYGDSIILDTIQPTAKAGNDQTVNEDTQVAFDGSASTDENGISTYTWTFTDLTPQTLTGKNPTYTFLTPGTYTITLKVTDPAGNTATDTVIITVLDITKPIANAGSDRTVNEDTQITLDGSASSDNVAITTYTWTFTDVTIKTLTGQKPTYTFNTPGVYTMTLNVTDAAGNWATDTVVITVLDITKPVANAGSDKTINVGTAVTFDAGGSTDNVGIVSYEWNFGDGTTGTGIKATHTYASQGTYTATLTVKDSAGNTATDSITITVHAAEGIPMWIIGAAISAVALATAAATLILWKRRK